MSLIGKKAPDFKAPAVVDNRPVDEFDSASLRGGWAVVFFYPLDFTFVCPTEIIAFSDAAPEFAKLGAQVIGVSVDSHWTHFAWTRTPRDQGGLGEINIPLVSDLNKTIARGYDCLDEDAGVAFRGVYILDPDGNVQSAIINNLPVGRNVNEVLRTLKGFKYVTEHDGEVCPANWDEGQDTMNPNPEGVAQYLGSH
jgi:peroxiredoxin (alkyl hydroperoxide reductase subunit C)